MHSVDKNKKLSQIFFLWLIRKVNIQSKLQFSHFLAVQEKTQLREKPKRNVRDNVEILFNIFLIFIF